MKRITLTALAVAAFTFTTASAANIAFDAANDAAYDDGWQSGDNGGSGFGSPWELVFDAIDEIGFPNPSDTFFIGSSTANGGGDIDTGGRALGTFAENEVIAGIAVPFRARAFRLFPNSEFGVGQTFSFDFDHGDLGAGNTAGFSVFDENIFGSASFEAEPVFAFGAIGGVDNYAVQDGLGERDTGVPITTDGVSVAITLTAFDTYSLSIGGTTALTGTIAVNDPPIIAFALFNNPTNTDQAVYFNSLAVTEIPEPAGAALAMIALNIVGVARGARSKR